VKVKVKVKVIPQQAEVAQVVPGRLRPRIFLTFGTTRLVGITPGVDLRTHGSFGGSYGKNPQ
jgi:hypothetical protein